jgi:hypothetical protein
VSLHLSRRAVLAAVALALSATVLAPRSAPAGTIAEQRQRLPPPAALDCADPVSGVWRAHTYYPRQREWYIFTLTVQRDGERLTGQIDLRGWDGVPTQPDPQPCRPGFDDFTVIQPAAGTIRGLAIDFGGTSWRHGAAACGHSSNGYILDRFIGTIDESVQEFQSVNRYPMGGQVVEDVTVFRRIQCVTADGGIASPPPTPTGPSPPPTAPRGGESPLTPATVTPPTVPSPGFTPSEEQRQLRFDCGCTSAQK